VMTATTPGIRLTALVSIERMSACATVARTGNVGLVGHERSSVNRPRPRHEGDIPAAQCTARCRTAGRCCASDRLVQSCSGPRLRSSPILRSPACQLYRPERERSAVGKAC
jgi:hypothetical protein